MSSESFLEKLFENARIERSRLNTHLFQVFSRENCFCFPQFCQILRYYLLFLSLFAFSCTPNQTIVQRERADPSDEAYYLYILGYNAEREGRWEDALTYYNQAIDLDPSSPYLKTQIVSVLLRTGKVKEAVSLVEDIIRTEPDYIPALMLLGELYNSQKKFEESIRIYEKVLEIQPAHQD